MKIVLICLLLLFSCYLALLIFTNVWLTETPLHPDKLHGVQKTLVVSVLTLIASIGGIVWLLVKQVRCWSSRRNKSE